MPFRKNSGRYGELGHWGKRESKYHLPSWNPSSRTLKILAILFLTVAGVIGSDQVAKALFPNSPLNPVAPYDPFTLLWNGTVTGAGSNPQGKPVTIVAQNSGGSSMGLNPAGPGGNNPGGPNQRWGQCILAGANQQVSSFQFSMKKIGSPTATISALIGATSFDGAGRFCTGFLNPATLSTTTFDASTLSTSFTYQNFTFATPFAMTSGTYYTMEVRWDVGSCVACTTQSNTANVEIASVSPVSGARESGYSSQNGAPMCANPTFVAGADANCPTTYDLRFNVFSALSCAAGYSCSNSGINTSNLLTLTANSTFPGVAITKSPIDVSTSSAKELLFYETWHNSSNIAAQPWAWYLTTNSTLPSQAGYNPVNDSNVLFVDIVYPTGGASTTKNYYEYQAKTGSQSQNGANSLSVASGLATNPYPTCPQTSTLYICDSGTAVYSSQFQGFASVLNFTGNGGSSGGSQSFSLFCVDGVPASGSPTSNAYCSGATQTPTITPCTGTSQEICATPTLPFLNMQSGPFFLGFWSSAGQTGNIQFGTGNTGTSDARANSVWYWVPNPTTTTPAEVQTTGFFGPVIKALLGIGIWIVSNILSFLPFLATLVFNLIRVTFNAIGGLAGWGSLGDNIFTFINGLPSLFGQVGAVLGNLASIVSSVINTIIIANLLANPYFAGLVNILNDVKNILNAGLIINFLTEVAIWFPTSYMIILISTYFLFVFLKGLHGFFDWIHLVKWSSFQMVGLFSLFIYVFGKLITALLGRMSIISPGHEFPHIPHPDPGELPKIHLGGEIAFFDDPTAWFLAFTGCIFTVMWAGTSAAGLPASTQTIITSFQPLFLTLFGVGFMILILYIPGFLLAKLHEKGVLS